MRGAQADGRRLWIKGMFAMGSCDLVDAPCVYVTAGSGGVPHSANPKL